MLVYLDSSALVKLSRPEPETRALLTYLRALPDRVTSVVSSIEVPRAVGRSSRPARALQRADRVLQRVSWIELDPRIRARAATLEPTELKALDAIHIASALELADDVGAFVTYDRRQAAAARSAGLEVVTPASDAG